MDVKLLKDSIQNNSLPKYICFFCENECDMKEFNKKTKNKKYLRYIELLKRQRIKKFIDASGEDKILYFDILVHEMIDFDNLTESIQTIINSNIVFYFNILNDDGVFQNELTMLITREYIKTNNDLSNQDLLKSFNNRYTSFDDLIYLFERWLENNNQDREYVEDILYRVDEVDKFLNLENRSVTSQISFKEFTFNGYTQIYHEIDNDVRLLPFDALNENELIWIFDSFNIEDNLPIIQYNDSKLYIKFNRRDFRLISSAEELITENIDERTICFYLSNLDKEDRIEFNVLLLYLNFSLIQVKLKADKTDRLSSLINSIKNIDVRNIIPTKISCVFFVFNTSIDDITFTDMILNDDIMNTYFYIDERLSAWSEKKRLILHMITPEDMYLTQHMYTEEDVSDLVAIVTQIESVSSKKFDLENGESVRINPGNVYIEVNIVRAVSDDVIYRFRDIFRKLLDYYASERKKVKNSYLQIFSDLKFTRNRKVRKSSTKKVPTETKRQELKSYAPDLFITNFPRECQKIRQPIPLYEEEIEDFTKEKFKYKNEIRNREVLPFPKDDEKYYFGCTDDKIPFIGVKKSNLKNSDIYPYIPCCFETPQMDPDIKSGYNEYYQGIVKENVNKPRHKLVTDKVIDSGAYAVVNRKIELLLRHFIPEGYSLLRYGVPKSNISLIHCVLTALKHPEYLESDDLENYAFDTKLLIFNELNPNLGRQEMYDYREDEIFSYLLSKEEFLDPKLAFRYIEEYFNVNIFVFKYVRKINSGITVKLQSPRYKLFHIRIIDKNRKTILILNNSDQCELLIMNKFLFIKESITLFDSNVTEYLENITRYINNDMMWNLDFKDNEFLYEDKILNEPQYQFIDENGKSFGYVFEDVIIITYPNRPFNVPLFTGEITFPTVKRIISLFGDPEYQSVNENNITEGLWYGDFYIPVRTKEKLDVKVRNKDIYFTTNYQFIKNIHDKRIVLSFILNSLVRLSQLTDIYDVDTLFDKFVKLNSSNQEYSLNLSTFQDVMAVSNVNSFLKELQIQIPELVKDKKLQIYDKEFYYNLIYFTNLFIKNNLVKFRDWKPRVMEFFKYEENFSQGEFVKIIIGLDKLKDWIRYQYIRSNRKVKTRLDINDMKRMPLMIYYDEMMDRYYFIQRAISVDQAINICNIWNEERVNNGLDTTEDKIYEGDYDEYKLNIDRKINIVENSVVKILVEDEMIFSILDLE